MVNVRAPVVVKVPAVIVTVNTWSLPEVAIAAVPAGLVVAPAVKARVPGEAMASPLEPVSVMTIFPLEGIKVVGVRDTVMVTPPAPLTALLRVIAGMAAPSLLIIAEKVPVLLASKMTPALLVVAAAMEVDAS